MKKTVSYNNNAYERYKKYAKSKYKSKSSADTRISAVKHFIEFLNIRGIRVDEADHADVDEFLENGLELNLSRITIQNRYSYLKTFFKYLREQQDNLKMDYSKVNFKREKISRIDVFSDEEIEEIFEIINKGRNKYSTLIIFKLMLYTGCTLNEIDSINVFFYTKDIPKNEKNYIDLEAKKIVFNCSNYYLLPDGIYKDIENHHKDLKKRYKKELPATMPLLANCYINSNNQAELVKLKYNSLQERMKRIKDKSSFKNKNLSLKNLRHTVIKRMINEGKDLAYISEMLRIDLTTLKVYLESENEEYRKDEFWANHPFRELML